MLDSNQHLHTESMVSYVQRIIMPDGGLILYPYVNINADMVLLIIAYTPQTNTPQFPESLRVVRHTFLQVCLVLQSSQISLVRFTVQLKELSSPYWNRTNIFVLRIQCPINKFIIYKIDRLTVNGPRIIHYYRACIYVLYYKFIFPIRRMDHILIISRINF